MVKKKKGAKKKEKKNVPIGIAHIHSTFNNSVITITDMQGNTLCWASAGVVGFKGSRKSSPFAAQQAALKCAQDALRYGMRKIHVRIKGPGSGRESAIRAIQSAGLEVRSIKDVTAIPHNGCRARKRRRV